MKSSDVPPDLFTLWEGAVAFRLFAEQGDPTLSIPEQIASRLGDRILGGDMLPGERIGEQELALLYGVSRGPKREALRILEREGLVTILPRRGAIVTALSPAELQDLMEVRASLFEVVIRKLHACPHEKLFDLLDAGIVRLGSLATGAEQGDAFAETVYRIHILCAKLAGNARLQQMLTGLALQTLRYSKLGLRSVERREQSLRLWQQATQALREGDVELTVKLTRQRIEESGKEAIVHIRLPEGHDGT